MIIALIIGEISGVSRTRTIMIKMSIKPVMTVMLFIVLHAYLIYFATNLNGFGYITQNNSLVFFLSIFLPTE